MANWDQIVREHGPMALETAWRLLRHHQDTEEVLQDALLEAFQLHSSQPVRNWGGLLRSLATRRAIDRLRRRPNTEPLGVDPQAAHDEPESKAIQRELASRLRSAVAKLPDQQATVFSLHCFGELTHAQIAETLNLELGAVRVALHKARQKLKAML